MTLIDVAGGAFLALGANVVLQLGVVPRVERRKRFEDRWERDVLQLHELLDSSAMSNAIAASRNASIRLASWVDYLIVHPETDSAMAHAEMLERRVVATEATHVLKDLSGRISRLARLVYERAPGHIRTGNLRQAAQAHAVMTVALGDLDRQVEFGVVKGLDAIAEIDPYWQREWRCRQRLTAELTDLLFRDEQPTVARRWGAAISRSAVGAIRAIGWPVRAVRRRNKASADAQAADNDDPSVSSEPT